MAQSVTTTPTLASHPPAPIYLSSISHVLLDHMYSTSGRIDAPTWNKRDLAFLAAHPFIFDRKQRKVIPSFANGLRMASRYRARTFGRASEMWGFITQFGKPYSRLKRIRGPSKLRLEIKPEVESESPSPVSEEVDFTPIRTHPYKRVDLATRKIKLYRRTRGELRFIVQPKRGPDLRQKAISLEKDGRFWEGLFGEYKPGKLKGELSAEETALERRGCWRDGRVVRVVDDEVFPGWGEDWAVEEISVDGVAENPSGSENALPLPATNDEVELIDTDSSSTGLGTKRPREDDDEGDEAEREGAVKKPCME